MSSPTTWDPPQQVALGVTRISLPMPFRTGHVNVHLVEDEPLTLVDAGPNTAPALRALEEGLAASWRRIEDIELVIVTHQHMDHVGLVAEVVRRSDARVTCLAELAPHLGDYLSFAARDDAAMCTEMRRHGVPDGILAGLQPFFALKRHLGSSFRVDWPLRDGDELPLANRRLRVHHRPGHSPSDTVLHDEQARLLFGGDHLLGSISSNPLIAAPLVADAPREPALVAYLRSLRRTQSLEVALVAAGHGEQISDAAALIDRRLRFHHRRAEQILDLLDRPRTAHEIAGELWGADALTEPHLTLSEALGHLELLVDEGAAVADDAEMVRFAAK